MDLNQNESLDSQNQPEEQGTSQTPDQELTTEQLQAQIAEKDAAIEAEKANSAKLYKRLKDTERAAKGEQDEPSVVEQNEAPGALNQDFDLLRIEARGILDKDEQELIQNNARLMNKSAVDVLDDSFVKLQLDALRKQKQEASVAPSNRGSATPQKTVQDYIATGETPEMGTQTYYDWLDAQIAEDKHKGGIVG